MAKPRTVRIIGPDNGMGLSRDRQVLTDAFKAAGWSVDCAGFRDSAVGAVAVNVHLETISHQFLRLAKRNIAIPNPEWWLPSATEALTDPSVVVWTKTKDAERIFQKIGSRTQYLGFCSVDRQDGEVRKQLLSRSVKTRGFLHIGGASANKNTAALVAMWQKDWPRLVVICAQDLGKHAPNVDVIHSRRPSDEVIKRLQNEFLFQIYPSLYEGFGHAQWEGLSCGSVVFVADGPPFDDHAGAFRVLTTSPATGPQRTGGHLPIRRREVQAESVAVAVAWAQSLTEEQIKSLCGLSRLAWEQTEAEFKGRAQKLIEGLDAEVGRISIQSLPPLYYVGRVNCVTGQGAAARHQLHVLRKHGLRFRVIDAGSCASPDPDGVNPFVQAARKSDADADQAAGTIIHLQPNTAEIFHRGVYPRPHILVSVWETTRLPAEWIPIINSYDQVWCATKWQRDIYKESGVHETLLKVVPFALDPELYAHQSRRVDDRTVFGSVFQWTERKDPLGLIGAYLRAFTASDPVSLVLKTYQGDIPTGSVADEVATAIETFLKASDRPADGLPKIDVVTSSLNGQGVTDFYRDIDCYVSAHRGEGFGFPIAEALLHGRPVIATNWSAPAEFAAGMFRPVRYQLVPPHGMKWQPFYTADQRWARAEQDDLVEAMRDAVAGRVSCDIDAVRVRFSELTAAAGASAKSALRELFK